MARLSALLCAGAAFGADGACWPEGRGKVKLRKGDKTFLCLVLMDGLQGAEGLRRTVRFAYDADLDNLAKIKLAHAWTSLEPAEDVLMSRVLGNATQVGLALQSEGKISYQKLWRTPLEGTAVTYPFLAAVIKLDRGEVSSITWDDGCYGCEGGTECRSNAYDYDGSAYRHAGKQCYVKDSQCSQSDGAGVAKLCELQIFVSWTGTDKDGAALLSQQMRFSRLEETSVASYVQSLQDNTRQLSNARQDT
ncbi:hypothetical protein M885DRAFT_508593 [Pelagophyceae sp. CCMP2097]|nr:hypothetical protein M885DRAFT_508593 [Pelagophyceae sp. CCMP2097]